MDTSQILFLNIVRIVYKDKVDLSVVLHWQMMISDHDVFDWQNI